MENGKSPEINGVPKEFSKKIFTCSKKIYKKLLTKLYFKQKLHLQLGNKQ